MLSLEMATQTKHLATSLFFYFLSGYLDPVPRLHREQNEERIEYR